MWASRRQLGWIISVILLVTIIVFLIYPYVFVGTPFATLFNDIEISVVVVLFSGMFFLLLLLLYLGSR
ncbi:MAG: hypothetical protein ACFFDP_06765 [Promethearchaeota archaeon]